MSRGKFLGYLLKIWIPMKAKSIDKKFDEGVKKTSLMIGIFNFSAGKSGTEARKCQSAILGY